jgi:hypothetical protein
VRLEEACRPVFARHETFHPRWGWMKKAFDAAVSSPRAFNAEDATLKLGVGKNMVRSIRCWGHAAKVLTFSDDPHRPRLPMSVPSRIGTALFGAEGWDPYTEDPGTLWLLHWFLLAPRSEVPVWWAAFCEFSAVEFTDEQLTDYVTDQIEAVASWSTPHPSSVAKDVSCLLRTYAPSAGNDRLQAFDDLVDCPMRELSLLRRLDHTGRVYRFSVGSKSTLPAEVMLYACLDFLARTDSRAQTVTVSRLASEAGAPGRAFKVTETDLVDLLEEATRRTELVRLARPAGVAQLAFDGSSAAVATGVLRSYYRRRNLGAGPADEGSYAGPYADRPADTALVGARTQLPLDCDPPADALQRLDFEQDRIDAGLAR